jgi:hypothetical protein
MRVVKTSIKANRRHPAQESSRFFEKRRKKLLLLWA